MYTPKNLARLLLGFTLALEGWSQTITTVAGNGQFGFSSGDGGSATAAGIGAPSGVAVDKAGNVYLADALNKRIRKVDRSGTITTFAGGGITISGIGDGGPATGANLALLGTATHQGIALDSAGNLYIADSGHSRIRKVDTSGIITTVAGNGTLGFSGDRGPAASAQLNTPFSVTVDGAGNLYICDTGNGRIRKVDTSGNIGTVAGRGSGFTLGDGGPATAAQFANPDDVAVDSSGNIFIADLGNHRIRKVVGGAITSILSELFGRCPGTPEPAANSDVGFGVGLALDPAGNLYIADRSAACIHKLDTAGMVTTVAGGGLNNPGDGGPATSAALGTPSAVAIDSSGNLYIADGAASRIRKVTPAPAAPPVVTLVANAFGEAPVISPNMWVEVKGSNLAPVGDSRIWQGADFVNNRMPAQLDAVSVMVNGRSAYVYYISPAQVNILTPPDTMSGPVQVQLTRGGVQSNTLTVMAQPEAPSFFVFDSSHVTATHLNGSLIGPAGLYPGLSTPAKPGETVILYANGFGTTSSPVVSGALTQSGNLPLLPILAIGGNPASVQFAGLVSPGLFQFNVVVPVSASDGNDPISAAYAGFTTQSGVTIAVQH